MDNITSISPRTACEGQQVTIFGVFAPTQPPNVIVMFGNKPAQVVSWSSTAIVVIVPAGAGPCCVGFRDENIEAGRQTEHFQRQQQIGDIVVGLNCLGHGFAWEPVPYVPSIPECRADNANFFQGTVPVIYKFEVNGGTDIRVERGTNITFTWSAANYTTLTLTRLSPKGPNVALPVPPGTSFNAGPFEDTQPVDAVYELRATNACAGVTAQVTVKMRRTPALAIAAAEAMQVIQRYNFFLPQPAVRLVARKRTLVRVYLESGLVDNFNYGAGIGKLPGVTGELSIWRGVNFVGKVSPANSGGVATATKGDYKWTRGNQFLDTLPFSLNFELPVNELTGQLKLSVRVWMKDPNVGTGTGWSATHDEMVDFINRRALRVLVIQVNDTFTPLPAVTLQRAVNTAARILDRFPLAEDGVDIRINNVIHNTNQNLTTQGGWNNLLNEIGELSEDFEHNYDVLVGVTPASAAYANNGIGSATSAWPPCAAVQVGKNASVAHEVGHTFAVGHAVSGCIPVGSPAAPTNIDSRLPGLTEDNGLEIRQNRLIPSSTAELMSYCTPTWTGATYQDRWPSFALWDILFNLLA